MGFTAGFVGLVVHSLGTNTFILVRIMEPFWFFVGIIAVLPMIESEKRLMPTPVRRLRPNLPPDLRRRNAIHQPPAWFNSAKNERE
jgi:hypothetical protein